MIVRKTNDGMIVINQTDHSRLAGQLAAHWGNEMFQPPDPGDSVIRAATFHDFGWLRYETSPQLNPKNGEPYSFLEVPLGAAQLASYQWALNWLSEIDPYAGLVVSMHRTGLWQSRYNTISHPTGYVPRELTPEILEFIKRNEILQEKERQSWDRDKLAVNYRLLQVWDLLALYFCCEDPFEQHIEPVPTGYTGKASVRMTLRPAGHGKVSCDPFPFDARPCSVQLLGKRLPKPSFESAEEFRRYFFGAETELYKFEII